MAFLHRSAFRSFVPTLSLLAAGCAPLEPEVLTLEVRAHSIDASERCRIDDNPDLTLRALGPFPVSNLGAERLPFRTPERTLTFPDDTEGVEATATDFESTWLGYTDLRTDRGIDVLLWRERVGCTLFDPAMQDEPAEPGYPGPNAGQAIGYSSEAGIVLVSGGDELESAEFGNAPRGSLVFHTGDGQSQLVPEELSFPEARAYATVTPFGSGLLLAGGEDPLVTAVVEDRTTRDTATFYDPLLGGFDDEPIVLELARTRHAAVELDSGETLLVGGGRHTGGGMTQAVVRLEAVSPTTRRTRTGARLERERLEPVALRLSNGNVLVGGGHDTLHNPVTTVEWFSADGRSVVTPDCINPPCELEARHHRAFVAMPGSGALTVGGCAPSANPQPDDCIDVCGENFGCPAPSFDATWIGPDGAFTDVSLEQPFTACPGVTQATPFSPEHVWLAPGSDGAPWLIAFDEDLSPPCRAVFRLKPWEDSPVCGATGKQCVVFAPVAFDLDGNFPDYKTTFTSLGPDVFVWVTDGDSPRLAGGRAGIRGALSQNENLLSTDSNHPLTPLHLAPDRPPSIRPRALFNPLNQHLILEARSNASEPPPVGVYVTDARYDDVTLVIGFTTAGPPVLLLGTYEIGGDQCAWPNDSLTPLRVTRRGNTVTSTDSSDRSTVCEDAPTSAVTLGFRARSTTSTITSLEIKRN